VRCHSTFRLNNSLDRRWPCWYAQTGMVDLKERAFKNSFCYHKLDGLAKTAKSNSSWKYWTCAFAKIFWKLGLWGAEREIDCRMSCRQNVCILFSSLLSTCWDERASESCLPRESPEGYPWWLAISQWQRLIKKFNWIPSVGNQQKKIW